MLFPVKEAIRQHPIKSRALACFLLMYGFITLLAGYGLGDSNGLFIAGLALVPLVTGATLAYFCKA